VRSALAGAHRQTSLLALCWFLWVLIFFSLPHSKLIGYIFPLLPAAALLLGPWIGGWRHRRLTAAIATVCCVGLVITAAVRHDDQPATLAHLLQAQLRATDRVLFWHDYFYAVPLILNRASPVFVVGNWSMTSREVPDSWRRELLEGAEFDERARGALLSSSAAEVLLRQPGATYVWARSGDQKEPLLRNLPVVARSGKFVVLRAGSAPALSETPNAGSPNR
jgi:hypothetical protein